MRRAPLSAPRAAHEKNLPNTVGGVPRERRGPRRRSGTICRAPGCTDRLGDSRATRSARRGFAELESPPSARNANRGMLFWGCYSYAREHTAASVRCAGCVCAFSAVGGVRALCPRRVWTSDGRCQRGSDLYSLGLFTERGAQGGHATREMRFSPDRQVLNYTRCTSNVRGLIFSAIFPGFLF